MNNVILLRLGLGLGVVCVGGAGACEASGPLSGTFRSEPGATAEYTYHAGNYHTVEVPVDVTVTFSGENASSMLTAIIHQPIIGVDENGETLFGIADEFPMAVTGTSNNGRDFHGDLLGTQYLFDWSFESATEGELTLSGQVGWAGGRVEVTTIDAVRMLPALAGDYNHDLTVSAADYVLWRKTVGQTGVAPAADGDGDNEVEADDYNLWRANFGQSVDAGALNSAVVPEPAALTSIFIGILATCVWRRPLVTRSAAPRG